jgi:hypothetical protein
MSSARSVVPKDSLDRLLSDPQSRTVVQELETYGYVTETGLPGSSGGAICRHPSAPDLLVHDDGRLELATRDAALQPVTLLQPESPRIRWGRTMLVLAIGGVIAFLGVLLFGMIVG